MKISLPEYSLIINKYNQKLINILENQTIYEGFLKILIFQVPLSRTICEWVQETKTQNIRILVTPPYIFWFFNMLIRKYLVFKCIFDCYPPKKCDRGESWSKIAIFWLRFFLNGSRFLYFC